MDVASRKNCREGLRDAKTWGDVTPRIATHPPDSIACHGAAQRSGGALRTSPSVFATQSVRIVPTPEITISRKAKQATRRS